MTHSDIVFDQYQEEDPCETNGYSIPFNREIKYMINNIPKILRTRVLTNCENQELVEVLIELFDDSDIDVILHSRIDLNDFEEFKQNNQLSVDFRDLPNSISQLFEKSVKNSDEFSVSLVLSDSGEEAKIMFYQKLRLRRIEILCLDFTKAPRDYVEMQAQFRFNKYKNDLINKKMQYEELLSKIEAKNPALSKRLRKNVEKIMSQREEVA